MDYARKGTLAVNGKEVGPPETQWPRNTFSASEGRTQVPNASDAAITGERARELIDRATLELGRIAAVVDSIRDGFSPTMELLEAGYAIQTALVALSEWTGGRSHQHWGDSWPFATVEGGWEP